LKVLGSLTKSSTLVQNIGSGRVVGGNFWAHPACEVKELELSGKSVFRNGTFSPQTLRQPSKCLCTQAFVLSVCAIVRWISHHAVRDGSEKLADLQQLARL
jgi:hypothetical protein